MEKIQQGLINLLKALVSPYAPAMIAFLNKVVACYSGNHFIFKAENARGANISAQPFASISDSTP